MVIDQLCPLLDLLGTSKHLISVSKEGFKNKVQSTLLLPRGNCCSPRERKGKTSIRYHINTKMHSSILKYKKIRMKQQEH